MLRNNDIVRASVFSNCYRVERCEAVGYYRCFFLFFRVVETRKREENVGFEEVRRSNSNRYEPPKIRELKESSNQGPKLQLGNKYDVLQDRCWAALGCWRALLPRPGSRWQSAHGSRQGRSVGRLGSQDDWPSRCACRWATRRAALRAPPRLGRRPPSPRLVEFIVNSNSPRPPVPLTRPFRPFPLLRCISIRFCYIDTFALSWMRAGQVVPNLPLHCLIRRRGGACLKDPKFSTSSATARLQTSCQNISTFLRLTRGVLQPSAPDFLEISWTAR